MYSDKEIERLSQVFIIDYEIGHILFGASLYIKKLIIGTCYDTLQKKFLSLSLIRLFEDMLQIHIKKDRAEDLFITIIRFL